MEANRYVLDISEVTCLDVIGSVVLVMPFTFSFRCQFTFTF